MSNMFEKHRSFYKTVKALNQIKQSAQTLRDSEEVSSEYETIIQDFLEFIDTLFFEIKDSEGYLEYVEHAAQKAVNAYKSEKGGQIKAIKEIRELTGIGLRDANELTAEFCSWWFAIGNNKGKDNG